MERNVPEYVSALGSRSTHRQGALVQKHLPQLLRHFPVCRLLPQAGWADDWLCQSHCRPVGFGGSRAALLWALLLRAGDAWHADRTHPLRGRHFHLWNHGRISHSRDTDGPVAGWLGGRGRRHRHPLHHEGPGPDLERFPIASSRWCGFTVWAGSRSRASITSPRWQRYLNWIPFLMILIVLWANRTRYRPLPAAASRSVDRLSECAADYHRFFRHCGSRRHRFRHEQPQPERHCSRWCDRDCCRRNHCRWHLGSFRCRLPWPECRTGQLRLHRSDCECRRPWHR